MSRLVILGRPKGPITYPNFVDRNVDKNAYGNSIQLMIILYKKSELHL